METNESRTARMPIMVLGLVVLLSLPILVLGWWGASKAFGSTSTSHYEASDSVQRVLLDAGDATVVVREAAVDRVSVDRQSDWFLSEPSLSHSVEDGALRLKLDCGTTWTMTSCDTDLTVTVPKGVGVSVDGGLGDVSLIGLSGDAAVKSETGDVSGIGLRDKKLIALTSEGDVALKLAAEPKSLDLSTDSGDIDVAVPSARYAVEAKSDSGDTELSGLKSDAASDRTIRAVSDVGDVSISAG